MEHWADVCGGDHASRWLQLLEFLICTLGFPPEQAYFIALVGIIAGSFLIFLLSPALVVWHFSRGEVQRAATHAGIFVFFAGGALAAWFLPGGNPYLNSILVVLLLFALLLPVAAILVFFPRLAILSYRKGLRARGNFYLASFLAVMGILLAILLYLLLR